MNIKSCIALLSVATVVTLSGCATTSTGESSSGNAPQASTAKPPVAEVPALKVKAACGACELRPDLEALIVAGYNEAAAAEGVKIASGKQAEMTIKEYRERNNTVRFMVGALAGKDIIKAEVNYAGTRFEVEDYYANAWLGMGTLAGKIGELAYAEMKKRGGV